MTVSTHANRLGDFCFTLRLPIPGAPIAIDLSATSFGAPGRGFRVLRSFVQDARHVITGIQVTEFRRGERVERWSLSEGRFIA